MDGDFVLSAATSTCRAFEWSSQEIGFATGIFIILDLDLTRWDEIRNFSLETIFSQTQFKVARKS